MDEVRIYKFEKAIYEFDKRSRQKSSLAKVQLEDLFLTEEGPNNPIYGAGMYLDEINNII